MIDNTEHVLQFDCAGESLIGILCRPTDAAQLKQRAVLIVVGGPQYRVGSHRQFVQLARRLAAAGYASLRFDVRGMGDSSGVLRNFEHIEADVNAALNALLQQLPALRDVAVWGLCDAASAALMFAAKDPRVSGLALLNPWARSDATLARTHLKHYYAGRIFAGDFWRKLLRGQVDVLSTLGSLLRSIKRGLRPKASSIASPVAQQSFQDRMGEGWRSFRGPILLILSGNDLTAREFLEYAHAHWSTLLAQPTVQRHAMAMADHTFSAPEAKREVEELTLRWLGSW